jgi:hypothetical protein
MEKTMHKTGKKDIALAISKLEKYDPKKERARRMEESKYTIVFGMPAASETPDKLLIIDRTNKYYETIIQITVSDIERIIELPVIPDPLTFEPLRQVKVVVRAGARLEAFLQGYDMEPTQPHIQLMEPELAKKLPRSEGIDKSCSCSCANSDYGQSLNPRTVSAARMHNWNC